MVTALAVPTRPGVVRAAPTLPGDSRIRLPPASPDRCDDRESEVSHLRSTSSASWRTCSSAQSSPTNSCNASPRARRRSSAALRENHRRPNQAVLTPHAGGHDIPAAINSPDRPAEARSVCRTRRPGGRSAHPPAATRHRVCRTTDPVTVIRGPSRMTRNHPRANTHSRIGKRWAGPEVGFPRSCTCWPTSATVRWPA
jgi:hypothetical protein